MNGGTWMVTPVSSVAGLVWLVAVAPLMAGMVWVTTSVQPGNALLTVDNTGEKLTPQAVGTLAEPFQRGTERLRTDHAGVGLGLAIVKSIAQAHDGTLTLAPRPGGGLCAAVELPGGFPRTR